VTIDEERGAKVCRQVFLAEKMVIENIHQELMSILADNVYGLSQIKIWLQRSRTGNLSCRGLSCAGQSSLTMGLQVDVEAEAFL
jgi:hypothetical protein